MISIPKVIGDVVKNDLCVGCGLCVQACPSKALDMDWNEFGFFIPNLTGSCDSDGECLKVCPFNPFPSDEVRTENELANMFLKEAPYFHPKVGKYYNTYVGYSEQYRLTSSSGGLATYILSELFDRKLVEAVITVGEGENNYYEYKLIKRKEDLLASSKTKYYPVTMANVLKELENFEGQVAVVGIGCFIKAVRLLQRNNPALRNKIVFTVGIICGGLKSKFYAEYLASKTGVRNNNFSKPEFRVKDLSTNAGDYAFSCIDAVGEKKQIKISTVGDMWGTGMFKNNACDFCDDVTTELPDISLGDAWLEPYIQDAKGTNIIVTRSAIAEKILSEGVDSGEVYLNKIDLELFIKTQQGSYNHRHTGLKYRTSIATNKGQLVPPKRNWESNSFLFDFKIVQLYRMKIRKLSFIYWKEFGDAVMFDLEIKKMLVLLQKKTKIYHYRRAIFTRSIFKKIIKRIF